MSGITAAAYRLTGITDAELNEKKKKRILLRVMFSLFSAVSVQSGAWSQMEEYPLQVVL